MRIFTLDAKLRAEIVTRAEMPGGDVMIVGEFQHPRYGKFTLAFNSENPPRLMIIASLSQRAAVLDVQPMIEALARQIIIDD